ncbi:MAG TPA: sigma 54-interacting transcriptional regulator, partial [Thermoanaerobaculia bacterium]|nr:sigma 54-interacting transcriptional regulator [Thermoanaerobaculia bacterium]
LEGHEWKRLVHPDDLEGHLCRLDAAVSSGEPSASEARIRCSNGEYLRMLHRIQPLRAEQGSVIRWFASSVDVGEARHAEETLRSAERELRTILETIPAFVWTAGADGSIEFVTRGWVDHVGEADAALGWEWTSRIHPEDRERVLESWRSTIASGKPYDQEFRLSDSEGKYRWVLARAVALRGPDGAIARWYGTLTDIEERKRIEQELHELKDRLYKENIALRDEVSQTSMFEEIVGSSVPLRHALMLVGKVASSDSTVLITGETGTGKELIARAIHKRSTRASRPFVSVNCGAIPPSLINSELFGHEKGAFTGALQRHLGRFELAEGGTLFLDEVGELPSETQVALLRVLQERMFERVGGTRTIPVDVRVIAATNRDLDRAIEEGSFRRDLYYRLSVFPISVPPLRDRVEDIPLLVEYLTQRYAAKAGKRIKSVSRRTLALLTAYDWPGNVRELQNVIQRAVILCEDTLEVDGTWLSAEPSRPPAAERRLARPNTREEKKIIEEALAAARGRVAGSDGAAARLGIPRSTLESRIRSLQINKNRFKTL